MRRWARKGAIVLAVIVFLAFASYVTTSGNWDGGFPAGEFRLNVRDGDDKPVQGAVLHVYRGGTRELAFKYPLDNYTADHELVSDENGRITAIRRSGRLQFGGHTWRLFWLIPFGPKPPEYDCELSAEGFQTLKFRIWRIFESPHQYYKDFPKTKVMINGEEIELPIYDHTFTLERSGS